MFFKKKKNVKKREAEERIQIMLDTAPFCAIFWDKDLKLVDCNQEAVKLFGLSSKQEFIEKFTQLSPPRQPDGMPSPEKGVSLVGKAMEEGYSRFEWMHQRLDGEPIPVEITCVRVMFRDEFTVTEYIRDLREQKAMISEMRRAEIAVESSKAKSDFLAKMSHEIRTPMNAILGITEIQLQDETLAQGAKDALERIYHSANLLLGIINDILDLSKIEAGKLQLSPVQYDIASLIHDTVQLNMMRYESKPIEFRLDVDEKIPLMLFGDEMRIKQILNNLLSNAFKYTQEGMINLDVSSEPPRENSNEAVIIFRVIDTGQGLTEEQIKRLGGKYERFNLETNRKTEGAGLGMNITRNLLHMMNGSIQIRSTPGMGSIFTVYIPQKLAAADSIGRELAENLMKLNYTSSTKTRTVQIKRDFMPYGKVLIVDDVETNLFVAKGLMAPYGLAIDTAVNGFEAIDKVRQGKDYDIIFMDHMMPVMDGVETVKKIRGMGYINPIVALTANALAGQAEIFLKSGFDDFISKPIDIRQLNISLNRLIRDKYPAEAAEAARRQKESTNDGQNQQELNSQLAEFFIRDAKKAAKIMESSSIMADEDELSMFIINTHAMKSALANIGEINLSEKAGRLEQAARGENKELVLKELPSFIESLYDVIEKFEEKETDEENSAGAEAGDNLFLKEKLQQILSLCSLYDKKSSKKLLAELREKSWPAPVKERLKTISGYLLHSDFEDAAKVINGYLEEI